MTCFLAESPASERDRPGIARTMRTLASASRGCLEGSVRPVRLVTDGLCADERRTWRHSLSSATVRGRKVSAVNLSGGQDPLGDPGSGVQP